MATAIRRFASLVKAAGFIYSDVVTLDAATATITRVANSGRTNLFNRAAGVTATLPAATGSGNTYRFVSGVVATGDYVIKVADATDVFVGGIMINDIGDSSAATSDFHPTESTSDTITIAFATGGGKVGDWVEVEDIAANTWAVRGVLQGMTDPATPFSATVS